MDGNLAFQEDFRNELIAGKVVLMAPMPSVNHNRVARNIFRIFDEFLDGKQCEAFSDGVDVYLTEENRFVPDMMVVCDPDKVYDDGVHGTPDFVVEVLSPATTRIDRTHKMIVYGQCGVKEYWIVDTRNKSVEVYLNEDGRMNLQTVYTLYSDEIVTKMSPEQRSREVVESFQSELFPEYRILLRDIFKRVL